MTREEKIKHLRQYAALKAEARDISETIAEVYSASFVGSVRLTGMPSGKGCDADAVQRRAERLDELCERYEAKCAELLEAADAVERAVSTVQEPRYRRLLRLRYIQGLTWERVADEMGYNPRYVFDLHSQALDAVML